MTRLERRVAEIKAMVKLPKTVRNRMISDLYANASEADLREPTMEWVIIGGQVFPASWTEKETGRA